MYLKGYISMNDDNFNKFLVSTLAIYAKYLVFTGYVVGEIFASMHTISNH